MNRIKSHLRWYTKNQRKGIFFLLLFIILAQISYFLLGRSSSKINISSDKIIAYQQEVDSLKLLEIKNRSPKLYKFNPNFISDFKGYQLGMTPQEIDRLHNFRKQNKWINSPKEFQEVTKVSDSLFLKIAPYFKFPDWVSRKAEKNTHKEKHITQESPVSTIDINKATAEDFKTIYGIGEKLSKRIIKYRTKLQGFSFPSQLNEVWGLEKDVALRVTTKFKIVQKPTIQKININTARFKEVLRIPYIDYELCKKIFSYRDEVAELQNINELKNIHGFPLNKYNRIIVYLRAE